MRILTLRILDFGMRIIKTGVLEQFNFGLGIWDWGFEPALVRLVECRFSVDIL